MVAQLDDKIIRGGFTDMQFVLKGQHIECCAVGTLGGFFFYRSNNTCVRMVPNFRKNEIWATKYNQGFPVRSSGRMMKFIS